VQFVHTGQKHRWLMISCEPPRVCRRLQLLRDWRHDERFEIPMRAVRMVLEHRGEHSSQWAEIAAIAAKIGCTAQTLSNWMRQAERDQGLRAGSTTDDRKRMQARERENRELRQANEILRKASAHFAQAEFDR
jgi:transposase